MPAFVKGGAAKTPFGRNEFLRSTRDVKYESYTLSAVTWYAQTIDTFAGQKVAQPGTVLAKITSGGEVGKVGQFHNDVSVTDGRQTSTNIVGLLNTFLPWQLMEADVEVAVVYEATVVQAWCFEFTGTLSVPVLSPLSNATRDFMKAAGVAPGVSILFK